MEGRIMIIYRFEISQTFPMSVTLLGSFFTNLANIELITPKWLFI